ncbi:MAG: ROK family protein [Negativicutes bacterium]|jgi:predicted NBD/HSP70 family sugar kinase
MQRLEAIVHSTIKEANEKRVLNTAIQLRKFTKNELVRQSGVSMTTVSKIVDEYTGRGILKVIGQGELITAGRKPSLYVFVSDSVYSVGVSFRRGVMEFIIVDLDLNIVFERDCEYKMDQITNHGEHFSVIVSDYIKESGIDATRIAGIGFTFPWLEQFDFDALSKSVVFKTEVFAYEGRNIPVIFENRANAAIFAEMRARDILQGNGVYVSVADGIDIGVLINGSIFNSRSVGAKTLAHMTVAVDGRPCRCGGKGCWDSYVSIPALVKDCQAVVGKKVKDFVDVIELCGGGDAKVGAVCENYGKMLAVGITNIILAYAPEHVVIGGKLMRHAEKLLPRLKQYLSAEDFAKVSFSKLDQKTPIMGAAMLPIQKVLYMGQMTI